MTLGSPGDRHGAGHGDRHGVGVHHGDGTGDQAGDGIPRALRLLHGLPEETDRLDRVPDGAPIQDPVVILQGDQELHLQADQWLEDRPITVTQVAKTT